jgi:hypothetical protein
MAAVSACLAAKSKRIPQLDQPLMERSNAIAQLFIHDGTIPLQAGRFS